MLLRERARGDAAAPIRLRSRGPALRSVVKEAFKRSTYTLKLSVNAPNLLAPAFKHQIAKRAGNCVLRECAQMGGNQARTKNRRFFTTQSHALIGHAVLAELQAKWSAP